MTKKLRDYQEQAIEEIRLALGKYKRVLFQLGTGGGKSLIFSNIALMAQQKGSRVLILSSRTEILKQNGSALQSIGVNIEFISPKTRSIPKTTICVGMSQTIKRRIVKPEWQEYINSLNMLIIDECHEQISDYIHDYLPEKCFVLGVTATPRRYSKMRQLGDLYKAMVQVITIQGLIDKGFLAKAKHYSIASPELDIPIDQSIGDYNQSALATRFENKMVYVGTVKEYLRIAPHKKAICFCVSAKQAIELTKEFNEQGVSAKYLLSGNFADDSMYSGERSNVIDEFKRSEFDILVNVGIAVAGLDVPDIEVVIANFATISMTKWKQALGRGARIAQGKNEFIILDCGANYKRLGLYEDEPEWCLWHSQSVGEGMQVLKTCDTEKRDINGHIGCGQMVPAVCKVCPACGYVFRTEKHEYIMHLEEISNSEAETIPQFVAKKKLEGWSTPRIMVQVCLANPKKEKTAFFEACKTLDINPKYWWAFNNNIWKKIKQKKETTPKLL